MAKFDLHQLLNERSKAAAVEREREPRTADGMEQLTLDVYDLIPSQENFYSTQYISDLKQSIAIVGLLQPLLVERDGDKFRVVAGHRRRLACMALVEDGLAQFRRVPCVTRAAEEEGTVKTILDRLALIFANGFREKSDWEKMEETLRTEALIAELRKEVEVEGRTRWITAEFTGITEAQIGRYKSIKNNLCPELMQAFKAKRLGVSTAYELSGLSPDYQARAADTLEEMGVLSINDAKALKQEEEARKPLEGQMELDAAEEGAAQTAKEAAQDAPEAAGDKGVHIPDPGAHARFCPGFPVLFQAVPLFRRQDGLRQLVRAGVLCFKADRAPAGQRAHEVRLCVGNEAALKNAPVFLFQHHKGFRHLLHIRDPLLLVDGARGLYEALKEMPLGIVLLSPPAVQRFFSLLVVHPCCPPFSRRSYSGIYPSQLRFST